MKVVCGCAFYIHMNTYEKGCDDGAMCRRYYSLPALSAAYAITTHMNMK